MLIGATRDELRLFAIKGGFPVMGLSFSYNLPSILLKNRVCGRYLD